MKGIVTLTGSADDILVIVQSSTKGIETSFRIIVDSNHQDLESVEFSEFTLNLKIDEQYDVNQLLKLSHIYHGTGLYFESSMPEIVSVDKIDGLLTAIHTTPNAPAIISVKTSVNELVAQISVYVGADIKGMSVKQETYYLLENAGLNGYFNVRDEVVLTSSIPGIRPTSAIDSYEVVEMSRDGAFSIDENGVLDYTQALKDDQIKIQITSGAFTTTAYFVVVGEHTHLEKLIAPDRIVLTVNEHYFYNQDLFYLPAEASLPLFLDYSIEDESIVSINQDQGFIVAMTPGQTILTYKDKQSDVEHSMVVTVIDSFPDSIEFTTKGNNVIEVSDHIFVSVNMHGGAFIVDEEFFKIIGIDEKEFLTTIELEAVKVGETDLIYTVNDKLYEKNYVIVSKREPNNFPLPSTGAIKWTAMIGLTITGFGVILYVNRKGEKHEA